jgi:hypothetical protein
MVKFRYFRKLQADLKLKENLGLTFGFCKWTQTQTQNRNRFGCGLRI